MARNVTEEPDITIVSDKGQIVIPASLRNKLDIKPRSKLFVYSVNDIIILKKMTLPDVKKEMQNIWNEVDKKIMKYGEVNEDEIQMEIEKHRAEKRRKDKGI